MFYNCVRQTGLVNKTLKGRRLLPYLNHRPEDQGVSRGSARAIKGNLKCLMPCLTCIWLSLQSARRLRVFDTRTLQYNHVAMCSIEIAPCSPGLLIRWCNIRKRKRNKKQKQPKTKKKKPKKTLLGFVVFHNWAQAFPNSGVVV